MLFCYRILDLSFLPFFGNIWLLVSLIFGSNVSMHI